jgi:RimJ/RimL family protein N-acetyltransferase
MRESSTRTEDVLLRDVAEDDLPVFFEHQRNPVANRMADFLPRNWDAFVAHWTKILADETVIKKTVLFDGRVAGNVVSFEQECEREVGYWIGREYWGKGVATEALSQFLADGGLSARGAPNHATSEHTPSTRFAEWTFRVRLTR